MEACGQEAVYGAAMSSQSLVTAVSKYHMLMLYGLSLLDTVSP